MDALNAVEWVPHVRCPRCRSPRVEVRKTMPAEGSAVVRYCRCRVRECRALFKAVETLSKI